MKANSELSAWYPKWNDVNALPCPPKLVDSAYQGFDFIDSLPLNAQFEEQYLATILDQKCANYYHLLIPYTHHKVVYEEALKKEGLPLTYAILPLILSGSNPSLKYLKDKSGAWQLSYVNARKYGLDVSSYYDGRNNLQESSAAAAKYIKFLSDYYHRNDMLILTAYYTSVPYVNKKLHELDEVNPTNFFEALSPEVQEYFSYIRAWTNWMQHFDHRGIENYMEHVSVERINPEDTLSFSTIGKFMSMTEKEIHIFNPAYIGDYVYPDAPHPFYLPAEKAKFFSQNYKEFVEFQKEEEERKKAELAALKKRMEAGIPDLEKYKAVTYTVKSGDVLGKIAQRHNVKVSQIKQWNHLKSDRINIGQKLVLYVPKNKPTDLPAETADNKIETKPKEAKPGTGPVQIYTVKAGDSLWGIAKKFPGVSADNIMEWNGITEKISPGQQLKIYQAQ